MLSGRRPFGGDSAADTIAAILRTPGTDRRRRARCGAVPTVACARSAPSGSSRARKTAGTHRAAVFATQAPPRSPSIAVLPFRPDDGRGPMNDVLCEGLAEEIINALTTIPGLKVIARTRCVRAGRHGPPQT